MRALLLLASLLNVLNAALPPGLDVNENKIMHCPITHCKKATPIPGPISSQAVCCNMESGISDESLEKYFLEGVYHTEMTPATYAPAHDCMCTPMVGGRRLLFSSEETPSPIMDGVQVVKELFYAHSECCQSLDFDAVG
mmetsp:Transcript_17097/g.28623  ORF Transcript_17097/g.28623 Transcript_17097/m.28623 type:complete len:139 (+) Transcript_17097:52-468(+)|eukprot:CAMPEP_0119335418 /NCGR_PEP_ID=MMETSP1333-20130426/89581_1 /TAXON_ID=418940 /ORGANISM="Scyphosphaera apsteinii, Strain RCC1455" /LENGTH=138 /DNA_ID=CAMNT_0007345967 /DNA_START=50 /DNA_END=466 /DNA_ORIENTATION=+